MNHLKGHFIHSFAKLNVYMYFLCISHSSFSIYQCLKLITHSFKDVFYYTKFSLINQLTLDKHVFKPLLQLPQSFSNVTGMKRLQIVCYRLSKVDSVTGRDDSLRDSLDFCYIIYLLFWVKVKWPLLFSRMRSL